MTDKQTLPRRSLFRRPEIAELKAGKITDPLLSTVIYKDGKRQPPKAKRYGKKRK